LGGGEKGGFSNAHAKTRGFARSILNIRKMNMIKEYDFSKGERGKFYRPDMKLNIPIYLDEEVSAFIEKIAAKKRIDRSSVVNELLRGDIRLVEAME
jgi:hypothetical protein